MTERGLDPCIDIETIRGASNGDIKAFEEIVDVWGGRILNHIHRYLNRDVDTAKDVLQETFVTVHRNLPTLRDPEKFKSWIYTIATNKCRDYLRMHKTTIIPNSELIEIHDAKRSHEEYVRNEQKQTRHPIHDVIDALPQELRIVFQLKKMEEMTYEEIASTVGCSLRTAKNRMEQASVLFEEELRKRGYIPSLGEEQ